MDEGKLVPDELTVALVKDRIAQADCTNGFLSELFQKGLDVTDEEGDDVTNGIFADAKTETDKTIWMLAAELGQAPGL